MQNILENQNQETNWDLVKSSCWLNHCGVETTSPEDGKSRAIHYLKERNEDLKKEKMGPQDPFSLLVCSPNT